MAKSHNVVHGEQWGYMESGLLRGRHYVRMEDTLVPLLVISKAASIKMIMVDRGRLTRVHGLLLG